MYTLSTKYIAHMGPREQSEILDTTLSWARVRDGWYNRQQTPHGTLWALASSFSLCLFDCEWKKSRSLAAARLKCSLTIDGQWSLQWHWKKLYSISLLCFFALCALGSFAHSSSLSTFRFLIHALTIELQCKRRSAILPLKLDDAREKSARRSAKDWGNENDSEEQTRQERTMSTQQIYNFAYNSSSHNFISNIYDAYCTHIIIIVIIKVLSSHRALVR